MITQSNLPLSVLDYYRKTAFDERIVKDEGGVEHVKHYPKEDQALGILLLEGVVIFGWEPAESDFDISIFLWKLPTLSWAEDYIEVPVKEIEFLFEEWFHNNKWGPTIWYIETYEIKPPPDIVEQMKADGVWLNEVYNQFEEVSEEEPAEPMTLKNNSVFQAIWRFFGGK